MPVPAGWPSFVWRRFSNLPVLAVDRGQIRYVQTIKTPIRDSHGKSIGIQIICWDVSESKRLKDSLEKVTQELAEAQRQLQELRNP